MSWSEYLDIAFGLLDLSRSDFERHRPIEIFMKLAAHHDNDIKEEARLRILCMYSIQYWDAKKHGKLTPQKLWTIPKIDRKAVNKRGLVKFRKLEPGEKPW